MNLKDKCPDFEEISAWHDKESDTDYSQHVDNCSDCQSVIEDLKKIDAGMSDILSTSVPSEGFKEKLLNGENNTKKEPIRFFSHILKLAAILATAFILNHFVAQQENVEKDNNLAEIDANTKSNNVPIMIADRSTQIKEVEAPISESLESEISKKDFQLVGLDPQNTDTEIKLQSSIKHVWLARDVEKAALLLEKEVHTFNISAKRYDNAGSFHITIQLSEKDLIEKVNWLSLQGLNLVSRDLPQPESNIISQTPDNTVTYNISIIKKK